MLIETIIVATAIGQIYKASEIDEKSLQTLKRAHNIHEDAAESLRRHKEAADAKLLKLINRKKAILAIRMPQFIAIYQNIQQINFQPGDGILELQNSKFALQDVKELDTMVSTALRPMSEKEMAVKYLMSGLGGMILADSKRNAEIANSQKKIATTLKTQAQTLEIAIDAIGERSNQIADILAKFSLLFQKSIKATSATIQQNGIDRNRYSANDRKTLMNCVNLAKAIKDILDVPILGEDGSVTEESLKVFQESVQRLEEFEKNVRYL